jgi:uncharacterized RmlC-like cupin family protein
MELQIVPDARQELVDRVERLVAQRTGGMIRHLRVECDDSVMVLSGRANTYYAKQLASHAALEACGEVPLTNDIEVF